MPEYQNPLYKPLKLLGANQQPVTFGPRQVLTLDPYFEKYLKDGTLIKAGMKRIQPALNKFKQPQIIENTSQPRPHRVPAHRPRRTPKNRSTATPAPPTPPPRPQVAPARSFARKKVAAPRPTPQQTPQQVVGKVLRDDSTAAYQSYITHNIYPISNGIGVGILSYNRLASLERLLRSIEEHTDLSRTTVFISDDGSTDPKLIEFLSKLKQDGKYAVLMNPIRLGIAGNSNRLVKCLSRFKYGILLNDDVEVLRTGWDTLYPSFMEETKILHFSFRQPGVYSAEPGMLTQHRNIPVLQIKERPHGAVLAYDQRIVEKIGYMDENYGLYGLEHVDWSDRATKAQPGLPHVYYDHPQAIKYLKLHADDSAVEKRIDLLKEARAYHPNRPTTLYRDTKVTGLSAATVVIPYAALVERSSAVQTVVNNIRAQRYPIIEIIVAEQGHTIKQDDIYPARYLSYHRAGPFHKSALFNRGVQQATHECLVLHDADMLVQGNYVNQVATALASYESCHLGKHVTYITEGSAQKIYSHGQLSTDLTCDRLVGYFEGGSLGINMASYWRIGGFNEIFVGYGIEDIEFYERMQKASNFLNDRRLAFIHLWHGRSQGWQQQHQENKEIYTKLQGQKLDTRIAELRQQLVKQGYVNS